MRGVVGANQKGMRGVVGASQRHVRDVVGANQMTVKHELIAKDTNKIQKKCSRFLENMLTIAKVYENLPFPTP